MGDRSGAPGQRSYRRVRLEGELIQGTVETSKQDFHPVLRYPIPDGSLCYVFEFLRRTTREHFGYCCSGCKKSGKTTSVAVNSSNLVGDPALPPHVCLPKKNAQERVERVIYKSFHEIAEDASLARVKPRQLWQNTTEKVHYNEPAGEAQRDEMLLHFYKDGYASLLSSIGRAVRKHHDNRVTMENVPREYALLPDGTRSESKILFITVVQTLLFLFSVCQLNLSALVADGVHDLQPDATNKTGQLYAINGVIANSVDVPILFAITKRKSQRVNEVIYGQLRDAFAAAAGPVPDSAGL
uniref:DDE_Tnp_1_7 domain-containing protein n=1 Tax=Haemonchus contortus TaxID=6289 RepID=A0A7I4Z3A8_HAECO